jgi:hypothetical protein
LLLVDVAPVWLILDDDCRVVAEADARVLRARCRLASLLF